LRFLVDMPVTPEAVARLRAAGHDAIHASAIGLARAADHEILEMARRERRVIVTADIDYPRLVILNDASGPGVILFRGGSYSDQEMLALLDRVLGYAARLDLDHS
jgi:predicted nuclease of predicted toxin-antitoxin system